MLTRDDVRIIEEITKEGGDIWNNPRLQPIKQRIKAHIREVLKEECCYCRRSTVGEFSLVLDIEHVLPKSKFVRLMFTPENLSVSCKRCNMDIKRDDTSFILDLHLIVSDPFNNSNYLFIHPNLDSYYLNMNYLVEMVNDRRLIKYNPLTAKGAFTYTYFKLQDLEIESIDDAQGVTNSPINEEIDPEIINEIQDLLAF